MSIAILIQTFDSLSLMAVLAEFYCLYFRNYKRFGETNSKNIMIKQA